ncbi:hypothetical protein MycrhN_5691 [Mycolicibacterium rhodesiae NBB3]|jgi:hypothetical protein|uniref:Uncharacterized protein n=1 Tax=Mycolicibacterium rhodesiae (strain NBB3) TaxID=710685 RepID=G8RLZ7_MYCRN|nr:hypothetical protein [Mycolicibacterium rhodesiae]AEV76159.1 hypothetical protein MycrhN_5691 [Mycolicibacterium rhodesiae NBB3]
MGHHTTLKRAIAAGLLSATFATPAAALLTAGTAAARPIESPNCRNIAKAIDSSMHMANVARDQGDTKAAREHMRDAARASANFQRHSVT